MADTQRVPRFDRSAQASAPGRICLFGEHQDYLGLPVIAAAINLRARISARLRSDNLVTVSMPDTGERDEIFIDREIEFTRPRDYFRSAIRVLRREGFAVETGFDAELRSEIPIARGCSSSSAILVAWTALIAAIEGRRLAPEDAARIAHAAEVKEFDEPGGMMDHYSSALGGLLHIECGETTVPRRLDREPPCWFLLCDSGEPKDTTGVLGRVKSSVQSGLEEIRRIVPGFSLMDFPLEDARNISPGADDSARRALIGALVNRDITREGLALIRAGDADPAALGNLLNRQQEVLRDYIHISTPRIDAMIAAALNAGALGCKINGSGGGGCMIACGTGDIEKTARAVRDAGGEAVQVRIGPGVEVSALHDGQRDVR